MLSTSCSTVSLPAIHTDFAIATPSLFPQRSNRYLLRHFFFVCRDRGRSCRSIDTEAAPIGQHAVIQSITLRTTEHSAPHTRADKTRMDVCTPFKHFIFCSSACPKRHCAYPHSLLQRAFSLQTLYFSTLPQKFSVTPNLPPAESSLFSESHLDKHTLHNLLTHSGSAGNSFLKDRIPSSFQESHKDIKYFPHLPWLHPKRHIPSTSCFATQHIAKESFSPNTLRDHAQVHTQPSLMNSPDFSRKVSFNEPSRKTRVSFLLNEDECDVLHSHHPGNLVAGMNAPMLALREQALKDSLLNMHLARQDRDIPPFSAGCTGYSQRPISVLSLPQRVQHERSQQQLLQGCLGDGAAPAKMRLSSEKGGPHTKAKLSSGMALDNILTCEVGQGNAAFKVEGGPLGNTGNTAPTDRRGVRKKRQRKFVCDTCGFGFYTNSDLQKVCCHGTYVDTHLLSSLRMSHNSTTGPLCAVYPVSFRSFFLTHISALFIQHVSSVHLLLRPYECSKCDKKFGERSNATKQ